MRTRISSAALQQIRAAERACAGEEACGLLFGNDTEIRMARRCANVAERRALRFEIDPAALFAAHRAMRAGGPRLIGYYHSHPSGTTRPSPRDAQAAAPDGMLWLIVAAGQVALWRAVLAGSVAGRFDPVPLDVLDVPCAGGDASSEERGAPVPFGDDRP